MSVRTSRKGPLQALKILDFSQLLPGPFCSLLLADMGADVLKIEPPQLGDALRWMLPEPQGEVAFAYLNRNKRSLALDLKQPEAIQAIHRLVRDFDIVIEGFRPGVMARLGLDYATLQGFQPGLIYCSISGYGQTGPLAQRAGHDLNYLSRAGVAALTGTRQGEPIIPGVQLADLTGAHQAALGILAAVIQRLQSGQGQYLDISLTDAACSLLAMQAAISLHTGEDPAMGRMLLSGGAPVYRFYRCADGRYLSVAALEPQFQQRLAQALQCPLEEKALEAVFLTRTRDEWCQALQEFDACVEPVLGLQEVFADPHLLARRMIVEVNGRQQPGNPLHFDGQQEPFNPAPALGQHTAEMLGLYPPG